MRTPIDCLPCFLKQASMVARRVGATCETEEQMVRASLRLLADADYGQAPPRIAQRLYPLLCEEVGVDDPYAEVKRECNDRAAALADRLVPGLLASGDPLRNLIKLSLAGNIIDFGVSDTFDLEGTIDRVLHTEPDVDEIERLRDRLKEARNVLYLADNAGEIAFDRKLIEHGLGASRVTLAVRGGAIINDVTRRDAEQVGLAGLVRVIDSGVRIPGTALELSSDEFVRAFEEADVIVSKGQGNFETLEGLRDPRVFYVFMIKCKTVAQLTGHGRGSSIAAFGDTMFVPEP